MGSARCKPSTGRRCPTFFAPMPFAPEVQQLIQQVEIASGLPVHVMEGPEMKVRATLAPARRGAPAHFVRFKAAASNLDDLMAMKALFAFAVLVLLTSCALQSH